MAFAARATALLGGLYAGPGRTVRTWDDRDFLRPLAAADGEPYRLPWHHIAFRLRAFLATAPDEEYQAAGAALAELRNGLLPQRAVTAYLLPTRTDWVDRDCADRVAAAATMPYRRSTPRLADHLLPRSVSTTAQLDLVTPHVDLVPILRTNRIGAVGLGIFPTIVDGVGAAAAPTFARWFDHHDCGADVRKRLLAILAELPTDEACQLLIDRLGHPYVPLVMHRLIKRFPDRATRLLNAAARGSSPVAGAARDLLLAI